MAHGGQLVGCEGGVRRADRRGAERRAGIDVVLDELGADAVLAGSGAVIGGEGRLYESSLGGKAPVGVARRTPPGVPVIAVCGECAVPADRLRAAGIALGATLVAEAGGDPERAMAQADALLAAVGERLARDLPSRR